METKKTKTNLHLAPMSDNPQGSQLLQKAMESARIPAMIPERSFHECRNTNRIETANKRIWFFFYINIFIFFTESRISDPEPGSATIIETEQGQQNQRAETLARKRKSPSRHEMDPGAAESLMADPVKESCCQSVGG